MNDWGVAGLLGGVGAGVFWLIWTKYGFWWGLWYGFFWPAWIGYHLAAWMVS